VASVRINHLQNVHVVSLLTYVHISRALLMLILGVTLTVPINAYATEVQGSDVRLQVDANVALSTYRWTWSVECAGQKQGAANISESGIPGSPLPDLGSMRFGSVADPENPARRVLMFRANKDDGRVAGAPRCELTFSPSFGGKLPVAEDFWFAVGLRLVDWVSGPDEQILMQWHWADGSIPLMPFLALVLKGDSLRFESRTSRMSPPSIQSTKTTVLWQNDGIPRNAWAYLVLQARISDDPAKSPYVRAWINGIKIVNYVGPVGYNYPSVQPYVKVGHYQWDAAYNPWSTPTKTVFIRAPTLIMDPLKRYREADVRTFITSH